MISYPEHTTPTPFCWFTIMLHCVNVLYCPSMQKKCYMSEKIAAGPGINLVNVKNFFAYIFGFKFKLLCVSLCQLYKHTGIRMICLVELTT